jgi:hypothetical protein
MNETIRTEYPYLKLENIQTDVIDASEDDNVITGEGQVLLLKFDVRNRGIATAAPEVHYGIYPHDQDRELYDSSAEPRPDDTTPIEAEDTQPPTDLSPRDKQEITITIDVVENSMIQDNFVTYEVYLDAYPGVRYGFLRDRRRKEATYPDNIKN